MPSVICGPNLRGSNLIRFHISNAVCLFLKFTDEIILNGYCLFFLSILEYSKGAIASFIKPIVKNLETEIRPKRISSMTSAAISSNISSYISGGKPSTTLKYCREFKLEFYLIRKSENNSGSAFILKILLLYPSCVLKINYQCQPFQSIYH